MAVPPISTPKWSFSVGKPMGWLGTTILEKTHIWVKTYLQKYLLQTFFLLSTRRVIHFFCVGHTNGDLNQVRLHCSFLKHVYILTIDVFTFFCLLIYLSIYPFIEFIGSFVLNLRKSRYVVSNGLIMVCHHGLLTRMFFRPTSKATLQIARIEEAKREEERIAAEAEEVRSRDFVERLGWTV